MDHLPALEVLSVECGSVEAAISSLSLVEVKLEGCAGTPFPVRSEAPQPVDLLIIHWYSQRPEAHKSRSIEHAQCSPVTLLVGMVT